MYALGDLIEAMDDYKKANEKSWSVGQPYRTVWLEAKSEASYRAAAALRELLATERDED